MPFSRTFSVATQEQALVELAKLAMKATVDPLVRGTALKIVRKCKSRDDLCELEAIYRAVKDGDPDVAPLKDGFKYVADPRWSDYFISPVDALKGCLKGACADDCLPGETLLLGAGYKFVPLADVRVGDVIMGDGRWTRVTQKWDKGVQDLLEIDLRNGCTLRCTSDHKLFRVPRGAPRSEAEEVRAGEIDPGDDLLTIDRIPFGREQLDLDRAWLLGVHVADGWTTYSEKDGRPLGVSISGQDGCRKEAQKRRVEAICAKWGISSTWQRKSIRISDESLARWLAPCGRHAIEKNVPTLDFDEPTVHALLDGLAADAEVRDGVFGSISSTLALQYRILLRMLGRSSHIIRVDDHGGFGRNPIYRVTPRTRVEDRESPRGQRLEHARVRSIGEGSAAQTYDIEVEGGRFYLPETDLVVHNCDGHAALLFALAGSIGWRMGLRGWGKTEELIHVYAVAAFPKRAPYERAVGMDTTVDDAVLGWEPPHGTVLTAWSE